MEDGNSDTVEENKNKRGVYNFRHINTHASIYLKKKTLTLLLAVRLEYFASKILPI